MEKRIILGIATALLLLTLLPNFISAKKVEAQTIPEIKDPTPGYYETSEYMIGSVAVGVIFVESNGTIDPNTEDWSNFEIQQCLNKVQYALNWWASQNPNANVSFVTEIHYRVPTGYEPISRPLGDMPLWVSEVMNFPEGGTLRIHALVPQT